VSAGQEIGSGREPPESAAALNDRTGPFGRVTGWVDSGHVMEIAAKIALQDLRLLNDLSHGAIRPRAVQTPRGIASGRIIEVHSPGGYFCALRRSTPWRGGAMKAFVGALGEIAKATAILPR
jgi:hypothetical protein